MKLLLDTHVAIWAVRRTMRLPGPILSLIADSRNEIHVSVVSIWEIAIKRRLQHRDSPPFSASDAIKIFAEAGFIGLDVNARHAAAVEDLPPHHRDPFDRLLVGQALMEPMRLVTHDHALAVYSDTIIAF